MMIADAAPPVMPAPKDPRRPDLLKIAFWALMAAMLGALVVQFFGCAHTLDRSITAFNELEQAQTKVVEAFDKFDMDYSVSLVQQHRIEGKEAAQAAWDKYNAVRSRIRQLILTSKVIAETAKATVPLIPTGQRSQSDLDTLLAQMANVGSDMLSLVQSLGVQIGGT